MNTLRQMPNFRRGLSVLLAGLILFEPEIRYIGIERASAQPAGVNPPRTSVPLKSLVEGLMAVTPADANDIDGDGLPDSIELVIGTDPNNNDSDFDRLDDYWEVDNDLDPMDPDSNFDGLPDYYEVQDANSLDADGDGISNAWDYDNDGDGVNDGVDLSPFAALDVKESFHFDITTNGNPAYMTFQLRPRNKEHLKLFGQSWDWPDGDHEGSVQDWDNSKEDVSVFPILQLSVNVAPDPNEVILNGIVVDGNTVYVSLMPVAEHGNTVAFVGRMLYPTAAPSNLTVDAELIWKVVGKNDPNSSILGEETLLVTYKGGFSITGMTVEESYGTEAGLFYSPDVNQTVAANLLMAYEFLRNSANHADDMPAALDANNIDVEHQLASFAHRDAALVSMANEMTPAALDYLPADQNLPVISILEDRSASLELSEFETVSDNSFSVDLTAEPAMTTKTLKTSWYNTSERQAMQTAEVMAEILKIGLNETTSYALMTLMLYWNTGEQSLEGAGIPPTDPGDDFEMVPEVVEDIAAGTLSGLELLYREGLGLVGLEAYQTAKLLHSRGWALAKGEESLADLAKMHEFKKFKTFVRECDRIQDTSRFFKSLDIALKGLDAAALFADAGFAAYSVVSLSQMSDLSGIALNNALMQVTMEYFYNCMLFMIGAIPYVGWLIAIGVELSDVFGDWSDDFIDWLVDGFGNVDYVVTPDVNMVGDPNIIMDDKNDNGLNVGDRIEFRSRLKGTIYGTEYYWRLVTRSEIYPYYEIFGPGGSSTVTGSPYNRPVGACWDTWYLPISGSQWTQDKPAGWRAQESESSVWIEPGTAMPNFPVYVELNAVYEIWYAWSWFSWNIFDWGWQHEESQQCGQSALGGFTIYFDVMPATISDFADWRGITPLDNDGDRLKDSNETQSDPWLYDTDADGLNDKYEMDIGANPIKYDTDGDGLIDRFEFQYGSDPNNSDTDGDGLRDSLEISGWVITFTYGGQVFTMQVSSDPLVTDSDSDGVDDAMEYWSDLNPRSCDSDGDGVKDVANPKYLEGQLQFEWALNMEPPSGGVKDIGLDAQENLYIAREPSWNEITKEWYDCIYKYDSNGSFIKSWFGVVEWQLDSMTLDPVSEQLYFMMHYIIKKSDLNGTTVEPWTPSVGHIYYIKAGDVDKDGYIYIAQQTEDWQTVQTREIMKFDPNGALVVSWGSYGIGQEQFQDIKDIAIDNKNGYLYVIDDRGTYTRIARFTTDGVYIGDLPDGYNYPEGMDVDAGGNVYVADTNDNEILKFDDNGVLAASMGECGEEEGKLIQPFRVVVADNNCVYVADWPSAFPLGRLQKFSQIPGGGRPEIPDDIPDRDGDGLLNDVETAGWDVTFTDANGTYTISVTSDPLLTDTDLEGLTDFQEYELGTNPQDPDTDNDGLSDFAEWRGFSPQTDPRHFDTDGDGLPDGIEVTYGSSPNRGDTDREGLPDAQEFALGSDPNRADTDGDGLDDANEQALNLSLTSPDSDGDFMFDGQEVNLGTGPNNADTDNDGLSDGFEGSVYGTNPSNSDSDGDGLSDKNEVELRLDPLSPDTDNDGVPDGNEIGQGTNPWNGDSDGDSIGDAQDMCPGTVSGVVVKPSGCPAADINGNGLINLQDFAAMAEHWFSEQPEFDFDCSGKVDFPDFSELFYQWLWQAGWYDPNGDPNGGRVRHGSGVFYQWLGQADWYGQ